MQPNLLITFYALIVLSQSLPPNTYEGEPIFTHRKITSDSQAMEEFLLSRCRFSEGIETYLFSAPQPIFVKVTCDKSVAMGEFWSVRFYVSANAKTDGVTKWIEELCERLPLPGWQENADQLSTIAAEAWSEIISATDERSRTSNKELESQFYKFEVHSKYIPSEGTAPQIELTQVVKNSEELRNTAIEKLSTKSPVFIASILSDTERRNRKSESLALMDSASNERAKAKCSWSMILSRNENHLAKILLNDSRWPILCQKILSLNCENWSTIRVERSANAKDKSLVANEAISQLSGFWFALNDIQTKLAGNLDSLDGIVIKNEVVEVVCSQRSEAGVNVAEIRFRLKPQIVKASESGSSQE